MTRGSYSELGPLTPRMVDVLRAAAQGASTIETGRELNLAPSTVQTIRGAVLVRLHARNIVEAVAIAYRRGVL